MTRTQKRWLAVGLIAVVFVAGAALIVFLLSAADPAADAVQAKVSQAKTPATDQANPSDEVIPLLAHPQAEGNTELSFTGSSALGEQAGFFQTLTGEVALGEDGTISSLRGRVDMESVLTNADSLTAKLKNDPGFFEVGKYPTAEFISTAIRQASAELTGGGATHEVEGNLTLRGITKSIRFPAKITLTQERISLTSEFAVNRQDFGVNYEGGTAFPEIRDLVLITLQIDAPRAPPGNAPTTGSAPSSSNPYDDHEPTARSAP